MKKTVLKLTGLVLTAALAASTFTGLGTAVSVTADAASNEYGLLSEIQGGAVLHCFDWSYNEIKANLKDIAEAGYTAVQTSPVQKPKDYNASYTDAENQWWKLYQPLSLSVADGDTSWLGTRAELQELCEAADQYGIKVIVDIVANHLANDGTDGGTYNRLNSNVDDDLNNYDYFHSDPNYINDDSRYNITQRHMNMPDLNTGNSYIQQKVLALVKDCASLGVDGFRFDAAKHIEVPNDDSSCKSDFWSVVINGLKESYPDTFCYGEILGDAGTSISNYTQYMDVTDNYSGDRILYGAVNNEPGKLADGRYHKGTEPLESVLWVESHDTYMGNSGSAGIKNTSGVSDSVITRAWAIVGSRANSTALFFARPNDIMGLAGTDTTWKSSVVAEVNKFKNYFNGQTEYLSYSDENSYDAAYNERGTEGAVISKLNGAGYVELEAHKLTDGTYTDTVGNSEFTVSGGVIKGTVSSSGVAVLYSSSLLNGNIYAEPASGTTFYTDTLDVTLHADGITDGQYTTSEGGSGAVTEGAVISVGAGTEYGSTVTVTLTGTKTNGDTLTRTYEYTKADPASKVTLYFDNSTYNWSAVHAYVYNPDPDYSQYAAWPGTELSVGNSGYYEFEVPEAYTENGLVIFVQESGSDNRYPADNAPGMEINGNSKIFGANHTFTDISAVVKGISLTLEGEIGLNYYVQLEDALVDQDILDVFVKKGTDVSTAETIYKTDKVTSGNYAGCYKITCPLNAAETEVDTSLYIYDNKLQKKITLYNSEGDRYSGNTAVYSVQDYIDKVTEITTDEKLIKLADTLDVYGKYSNYNFNSDTEDPGLDSKLPDINAEDLSEYQFKKSGDVPEGVTLTGATLMLTSKTSLRIYIETKNIDSVTAVFDGNTLNAVNKADTNYYYYQISEISAQDLDTEYTVKIGDCEIKLSALTYAYSALKNSKNEKLVKTVKALYAYNLAANEYFA